MWIFFKWIPYVPYLSMEWFLASSGFNWLNVYLLSDRSDICPFLYYSHYYYHHHHHYYYYYYYYYHYYYYYYYHELLSEHESLEPCNPRFVGRLPKTTSLVFSVLNKDNFKDQLRLRCKSLWMMCFAPTL